MLKERIAIIIPCYNVSPTVVRVLKSLDNFVLDSVNEIICLDNCSNDSTRKVLQDFKNSEDPVAKKLTITENSRNYQYGGNIKIGFRYCLERGFDRVAVIHSDEQGNSNQILTDLIKTAQKNTDLDFVLASRFCEGSNLAHYSALRTYVNLLFNWLTAILTGVRLSDAGAAMILIKTSALRKVPFFELTNGFHYHPQLNILLCRDRSLRKTEIPMAWSDSEIGSNVRIWRYGFELLTMLFRFRMALISGKKGAELFTPNDRDFNPQVSIKE